MYLNGEHFHTLQVSHCGLNSISAIPAVSATALPPLIKAPNGPNGAISLKQTINSILFYFCNRQYFGVQKAKNGDRGTTIYSAAVVSRAVDCKPCPFFIYDPKTLFVWFSCAVTTSASAACLQTWIWRVRICKLGDHRAEQYNDSTLIPYK